MESIKGGLPQSRHRPNPQWPAIGEKKIETQKVVAWARVLQKVLWAKVGYVLVFKGQGYLLNVRVGPSFIWLGSNAPDIHTSVFFCQDVFDAVS